jgi:hypothetical protein
MNTYIETIEAIQAAALESPIKDNTTLKKHQGL